MTKSFDEIKNHAIEQSDRPESITRKEAETIIRGILKDHKGDLSNNIFVDSVDNLMEEVNGCTIIH